MQRRPIIAGVDGTPESLAAAEWAGREAVRLGAPLHLLYARSLVPYMPGADHPEAAERQLIRRLLRKAERRVQQTASEVELNDRIVDGPPVSALVDAAEQAELVVLGSRGLSGFTGFLLGSVALGVVAHATRPVVLVRAQPTEPQDSPDPEADGSPHDRQPTSDVLLGLDISAPCDPVIDFAFEAARLRSTRLRVVHAWGDTSVRTLDPTGTSLIQAPETEEQWTQFVAAVLRPWREKFPEVPVTQSVAKGKPAARLLQAVNGAALLVVGRRIRERHYPAAQTGSVTHAVIHHARCPVVVVPHT